MKTTHGRITQMFLKIIERSQDIERMVCVTTDETRAKYLAKEFTDFVCSSYPDLMCGLSPSNEVVQVISPDQSKFKNFSVLFCVPKKYQGKELTRVFVDERTP